MTGKSHIIMNTMSAVTVFDTWFLCSKAASSPEWLKTVSVKASDFVLDNKTMPFWLFLSVCIVFYMLGGLLPDVDVETSILGRFIYVPVGHRTWFHAVYIPIVCFVTGIIWFRPLIWLGFGYMVHLFWDSFSVERIRYFYPAKARFGIGIYHTHQMSEYIFLSINCFAILIYTVFVLQVVYQFMSVSLTI